MRPRFLKVLRGVGYAAFTVFALLLSLYATFPSEAVGLRLAYEIGKATGGKIVAKFGDVGLYRLTGIEADDVRLEINVSDPPIPVALDAVRARLQILPLFLFDLAVSLEIEVGDGVIEGMIAPGEKGTFALEVEIDELDVASPPILSAFAGMPISGVITGKAKAHLTRDIRRATGDLTLTLSGIGFGPGEPIKGFTLPNQISFGQLDVALSLQNGRVRLAHFSQAPQPRPDVEIRSFTGSVNLRPNLRSSTYDTCIELKLDDGFLERNKKFKAVIDLATIPPPVGPGLKKGPDGFLHASISGSFASKPKAKGTLCRRGAAQRRAERDKRKRPGRSTRGAPPSTAGRTPPGQSSADASRGVSVKAPVRGSTRAPGKSVKPNAEDQ